MGMKTKLGLNKASAKEVKGRVHTPVVLHGTAWLNPWLLNHEVLQDNISVLGFCVCL
jgi:hypothetical protein